MRIAVTMLMALALAAGRLYGDDTTPPPTPDQEQPEVLTSGPVHEAFAEPVNVQPQAGLVVPDEPPAAIAEVPPDERPQGTQFVWVPGYWAWDTGRHGYIWVSACWRAAPPKMYWVPGYWARVPEGWEWIPGFWAPVVGQKIEYLPAPPALVTVEPPGPPPTEDDIWVPPCHYWYEGHYILRAGYWLHAQPDWIWIPSHYSWTPRGYVFVMGHWDYALPRRGVLFAPVYIPHHVHVRPGYSYRLSITIDLGALHVNLFTHPRYSHYCFGDYYDDAYLRIGIYPHCESARVHTWYDPIYVHDRWRNHRTQPRWDEDERHEYDRRRADRDLRPPRTYHEMEVRQAKLPEPQRRNLQMARTFPAATADRTTPFKFEPVKFAERKKITQQATDVHKFGEQRHRWESPAVSHKTVEPLPQPKAAVTPPTEHKEEARPPVEHKEPVRSPGERKEQARPPAERKEQVAPVKREEPTRSPAERKEPRRTVLERKEPATPPAAPAPKEEKSSVAPKSEHAPEFVAPREVKVTKPEVVRIPRPPIIGRSISERRGEIAPPSKPAEEQRSTSNTRGKALGKDKGKDNGKSK
jgi:hypothetical protein